MLVSMIPFYFHPGSHSPRADILVMIVHALYISFECNYCCYCDPHHMLTAPLGIRILLDRWCVSLGQCRSWSNMGQAFVSLHLNITIIYRQLTVCRDIWGRKPILLSAVALWFVSSIVCALSHSMKMLLIGRTFQGVAGGGLIQVRGLEATAPMGVMHPLLGSSSQCPLGKMPNYGRPFC